MKRKNNEGFSLVEILVAMAILAAAVIPACSSLILSHRLNAKTDSLLQKQLAVSSAVEALMAKGIPENYDELVDVQNPSGEVQWWLNLENNFPGVTVSEPVPTKVTETIGDEDVERIIYYNVSVSSEIEEGKTEADITVTITVRAVDPIDVEAQPPENEPQEGQESQGGGL